MNRKLHLPDRGRGPTQAKRGFVVISVIVLFVVAAALFGLWAKMAVRDHRQLEYRRWELQAIRLAEAGVGRGRAQIAVDSTYEGETWTIPAAELKRTQGAEVRIRVVRSEDDEQPVRVEATAEFPSASVRHAQHTKRIEISSPTSASESQP